MQTPSPTIYSIKNEKKDLAWGSTNTADTNQEDEG